MSKRSRLENLDWSHHSGTASSSGGEHQLEVEDSRLRSNLFMAFDAQKKINRQLEDELQKEKNKRDSERAELLLELEKLKEENENQRKILLANVTKSPQSQTEALMLHEIKRLTSENLDLQEKLGAMNEQCKQLTKQTKMLL